MSDAVSASASKSALSFCRSTMEDVAAFTARVDLGSDVRSPSERALTVDIYVSEPDVIL